MKIIRELQDLTSLEWTRTRHSSGTAGSFLKSYEIRKGQKYYYKLSNYDVVKGIVGHECINEIIVDRLLTRMEIPHLSYELVHARIIIKGKEIETYLCRSKDFKEKQDSKTALDVFYDMEARPDENPFSFCLRMGWDTYLYQMLLVDFLILNRDRHGANIEILKNRKTKMLRPAPLFDHGLSLAFSCYSDEKLKLLDPSEDKPVQCFVASSSTWENLKRIPKDKRRNFKFPIFDEEFYAYLFQDLSGIVSDIWIETIWNMLKVRSNMYEDFCNQK